jgi:hypothetical protein
MYSYSTLLLCTDPSSNYNPAVAPPIIHTATHPSTRPVSTFTPALSCNPNRSPLGAVVVVLLAPIDTLGLGFREIAGVVEESGTGSTRYTVLIGGVGLDIVVIPTRGGASDLLVD